MRLVFFAAVALSLVGLSHADELDQIRAEACKAPITELSLEEARERVTAALRAMDVSDEDWSPRVVVTPTLVDGRETGVHLLHQLWMDDHWKDQFDAQISVDAHGGLTLETSPGWACRLAGVLVPDSQVICQPAVNWRGWEKMPISGLSLAEARDRLVTTYSGDRIIARREPQGAVLIRQEIWRHDRWSAGFEARLMAEPEGALSVEIRPESQVCELLGVLAPEESDCAPVKTAAGWKVTLPGRSLSEARARLEAKYAGVTSPRVVATPILTDGRETGVALLHQIRREGEWVDRGEVRLQADERGALTLEGRRRKDERLKVNRRWTCELHASLAPKAHEAAALKAKDRALALSQGDLPPQSDRQPAEVAKRALAVEPYAWHIRVAGGVHIDQTGETQGELAMGARYLWLLDRTERGSVREPRLTHIDASELGFGTDVLVIGPEPYAALSLNYEELSQWWRTLPDGTRQAETQASAWEIAAGGLVNLLDVSGEDGYGGFVRVGTNFQGQLGFWARADVIADQGEANLGGALGVSVEDEAIASTAGMVAGTVLLGIAGYYFIENVDRIRIYTRIQDGE